MPVLLRPLLLCGKTVLNIDMAVENQEWAACYLNTVQNDTPIEDVPHVFRYGLVRRLRRPKPKNWLNEVFNPEIGVNRLRLQNADDYGALMDAARGLTGS